MNTEVFGNVSDATQVKLRCHSGKGGVLRGDDGLLNTDVVDGSLLVGTGVLYLPEADDTTTGCLEVFGDVPNLHLVRFTIEVNVLSGVDPAINVISKAVALLKPLRQSKDFVGRPGLETRRAAIVAVGVVVDACGARWWVLALVKGSILGHGYDSPRAGLNRNGGGTKTPLVIWREVVHHRIPGNLLNV